MEECWDHDPEARLSAGCVEERLTGLRSLATSQQQQTIITVPQVITVPAAVIPAPPDQPLLAVVVGSELREVNVL